MYPSELLEQGLTEKVLSQSLNQVRSGREESSWKLSGIPTVGFYRQLHYYLKRQPMSKVLIGKLYCAIDCNFKEKASRPDNTYRFVDNIVTSERQSDEVMLYNIPIIQNTRAMLKKCSEQIDDLNAECLELRKEVEASRTKLREKNRALCDMVDKNQLLKKKYESSKARVKKMETDYAQLELDMQSDSSDEEAHDSDPCYEASKVESTLQDIVGHRKYSPEIRKLYYSLLADQVSVSKITHIVKSVLRCFNPGMNVDELRLPKKHVLVICARKS